jgi:hypothetical protein
MPPGWSHDGSTKTAKQLRRELLQKEKKYFSGQTKISEILKFK